MSKYNYTENGGREGDRGGKVYQTNAESSCTDVYSLLYIPLMKGRYNNRTNTDC